MRLNIFAGWVGFLAVLGSFFSLAGGLVAAGSGHSQLALVAAIAFVIFAGTGIAVVGSTVHHDHKLNRDIPHLF